MLFNKNGGSLNEVDHSRTSSEMKNNFVQRDRMGEASHVNKIVTHRGEGLSDLLFMKKDFN